MRSTRVACLPGDFLNVEKTWSESGSKAPLSLSAVAAFPAIAFLIVVHRAVLAGLFAIRLVRCKRRAANRRRQNRKQGLRIIFHRL